LSGGPILLAEFILSRSINESTDSDPKHLRTLMLAAKRLAEVVSVLGPDADIVDRPSPKCGVEVLRHQSMNAVRTNSTA
jgi:hypothetical protein